MSAQAPARAASKSVHDVEEALDRLHRPWIVNHALTGFAAGVWFANAAVAGSVPDTDAFFVEGTVSVTVLSLLVAVSVGVLWSASATAGRVGSRATAFVSHWTPWTVAAGVWLLVWEWTTAKTGALVPPYFAAPQQLFAEAWKDRGLLISSFGNSMLLLAVGFFVGLIAGLSTGLLMGWSKQANYWIHPVLQYIGPVPALAWVPIIFVTFPTAYSGAVFLIALGVWFPVTLLTRAGILSVPRSYYDVVQTLGGDTRFLIFRVSLPSALPSIFTGTFMALGVSFVTLTIAENFGVNSGLGWYINWKKGWSAYPAMYAAIVLMVVFCGGLMSLLLFARSRVLSWQKDLTRW